MKNFLIVLVALLFVTSCSVDNFTETSNLHLNDVSLESRSTDYTAQDVENLANQLVANTAYNQWATEIGLNVNNLENVPPEYLQELTENMIISTESLLDGLDDNLVMNASSRAVEIIDIGNDEISLIPILEDNDPCCADALTQRKNCSATAIRKSVLFFAGSTVAIIVGAAVIFITAGTTTPGVIAAEATAIAWLKFYLAGNAWNSFDLVLSLEACQFKYQLDIQLCYCDCQNDFDCN